MTIERQPQYQVTWGYQQKWRLKLANKVTIGATGTASQDQLNRRPTGTAGDALARGWARREEVECEIGAIGSRKGD